MRNIFQNEEAYGILGVDPDCTMRREFERLPPREESEILGSRAFHSKQSLARWMTDDNHNHHRFLSRYENLWNFPESPLFPGFLVGPDPDTERDFIDGNEHFLLWVESGKDRGGDKKYELMGTYSLQVRSSTLSGKQFELMAQECQDRLISMILLADDDCSQIEKPPMTYAQIKRQARSLGVAITVIGIRGALQYGILGVPVFRIEPHRYDVTDLDELYYCSDTD